MAFPFAILVERLQESYRSDRPALTRIALEQKNPFLVLVGCLLSLRTKDETTEKAMEQAHGEGTYPRRAARRPDRGT